MPIFFGFTASRLHGFTASRLITKSIFVTLFLTIFWQTIGLTQTDFFVSFSNPNSELSTADKAIYDKFAALPSVENIQLVKMGNLRTRQSNGNLTFHLPSGVKDYVFRVSQAEYTDDANYVWTGSRMDEDSVELPDYALLVNSDGKLGGEVIIDKRMYKIFPVNSQYQAFVKTKIPNGGHCQLPAELNPPQSQIPCVMNTDKCYTDVLIMYTPGAAALVPNISTIGKIAFEQLNNSFQRSLIKQRVRLVGVEQLLSPAWVDKKIPDEVDEFKATLNTLGSYSNVLRNERHADLVVLLTSGVNHTDVIGQVATILPTTPDGGCAVIGINNAVNATYTFVHEVGHLFGGRHENDPSELPARAHEFDATYGGVIYHYLTMMISVGNPIPNFSNPKKSYLGVPTGEAERNNACKIQNSGCSVAGLVASTLCRIRATSFVCPDLRTIFYNLTLKNDAGISCPVDHWGYSYSTDGVNYTPEAAIIVPYLDMTYPVGTKIVFFRFKAYNDFGDVKAISFEWVDLTTMPNIPCIYKINKPPNTFLPEEIGLFPNPATDQLEVSFDAQIESPAQFEIFNLQGQAVLKAYNQTALKGKNQFIFDISNLAPGMYLISGKWNGFSNQLKFIKQ